MKTNTLILVLLSVFVGTACEKTGLTQSRNSDIVQPSPTADSSKRPSKEFSDRFNAGVKLQESGKFPDDIPKAIEEYKKALEIKPDDKVTYQRIVESYLSISKYEEAEVYLRKMIEADPENGYAHWSLAQILVDRLNKFEEGLREVEISEKLYGDDGLSDNFASYKGKAYEGLGDYENALKQYKIYLKAGTTPDADDDKEIKAKVFELEKIVRRPKSN